MKKLIAIAAAGLLLAACGPTTDDAVKYNDSMMDIIDGLKTSHEAFMNQIDGHNIDSLKITHSKFEADSKASLEKAGKVGAFDEKKDFRDVINEYFATMNGIATGEGRQMVEIMSKDSARITDEDIDRINTLAESFDKKYETAYDKVRVAQEKFSKEWNFKLLEEKH